MKAFFLKEDDSLVFYDLGNFAFLPTNLFDVGTIYALYKSDNGQFIMLIK